MKNQGCYLLDGHFCLLNKDGKIVKIQIETFFELSPKAIVVLSDSTEAIIDRLKDRDGIKYDKNLIKNFQNEELRYSNEISHKLSIPYMVYNKNSDIKDISQFIINILNV